MTHRRLLLACSLILATLPTQVSAQGVLVDIRPDHAIRLPRPIPWPPHVPSPPPPASYKIDSIEVNAKLTDQVARVQVSQIFENTGSVQLEACFMFPLPYDGAVDQLLFALLFVGFVKRVFDGFGREFFAPQVAPQPRSAYWFRRQARVGEIRGELLVIQVAQLFKSGEDLIDDRLLRPILLH